MKDNFAILDFFWEELAEFDSGLELFFDMKMTLEDLLEEGTVKL